MPGEKDRPKAGLLRRIDTSWSALDALVRGLGSDLLGGRKDREGWAVKDHLIHLAVWEDSVSALFQGRPRHDALGVDETTYASASTDEVNRQVFERTKDVPAATAKEWLAKSHATLMGLVRGAREADLAREVRDLFPSAPSGERRRVLEIINENTAEHFDEHRGWIEELVAGT
jgi:hypothetical protein